MANGSASEETSTGNGNGASTQVVFPLTGSENYALWSRSFRIGLVGKSKLGFVDGRFPKSICTKSVARSERKGTMSVADYHSRLRDLWDEYDALMPCPSCPCPESKKFGEHCDYQRLLQFLMGLNESYSTPRSQILMMSPMPTLNKAYALIIDQESQRNLASSASNSSGVIEGTAMYTHRSNTYSGGTITSKNSFPSGAGGSYSGGSGGGYSSGASSSGGSYKARKSLLVCEHCGCKGHSREQCYKIVGYPADFKSKRKPNVYANQATASEESGNNSCQSGAGAGSNSGAFFTSDQYQQILQLLTKSGRDKVGESSANIATVVNAGASHHITSNVDLVDKATKTHAHTDNKVHLPNGKPFLS
ncbi:hypothetical protein KY284_013351 [Solanum tuberosum]|nr:hypothetical protein KY284_013351 [Solanum tuberosum]